MVYNRIITFLTAGDISRKTLRKMMGECISHNERCRSCEYRLVCGAGCRACACGETGTDYLGIDEEVCYFFKSGWYHTALKLVRKYKDSFPDNTFPVADTIINT